MWFIDFSSPHYVDFLDCMEEKSPRRMIDGVEVTPHALFLIGRSERRAAEFAINISHNSPAFPPPQSFTFGIYSIAYYFSYIIKVYFYSLYDADSPSWRSPTYNNKQQMAPLRPTRTWTLIWTSILVPFQSQSQSQLKL